MKKYFIAGVLMATGVLSACSTKEISAPTSVSTSDHQAESLYSAETRNLSKNLTLLQGQKVLFGHQDTLAYGFTWNGDLDRSDVKDVTGDFPAVYGWDLGWYEKGSASNLDDVDFAKMREDIKRAYLRGGLISLSWHPHNPLTGGLQNDTSVKVVSELIPGGAQHQVLVEWLDKIAEFNASLVVTNQEGVEVQVPVIFRPWHEHNGEWFWWGQGHATEAEYISLWRFTVDYLRHEKQQNNLLFAFSPDRSRMDLDKLPESYLYAYPGDEYIDVIGLDNYWDFGHEANTASPDEQFKNLVKSLEAVATIAHQKNKIPALTEGGSESIPNDKFWTDVLAKALNATEQTRQITWALVWRNATDGGYNDKHFYVPYLGHPSAADFINFKNDQRVLFESELPNMYQ